MDSKANVVDGGFRVRPSRPEAKRLGIDLIEVALPKWPKRPLDGMAKEAFGGGARGVARNVQWRVKGRERAATPTYGWGLCGPGPILAWPGGLNGGPRI